MKDFILLARAEITRDYIFIKRYPLEIIGSIFFLYFVFLLTFFSVKFVYKDGEPIFFGSTAEGWVIGYLMWMFGTTATVYMSDQLNKEAKIGTLEHLYISNFEPIYILLARVFSTFFYTSVTFLPAFYLLQLSTGVYINLKFGSILPILILTFIGLSGFGFILAGITLIFKRLGALSLMILPFFPFGLVVLPLESLSGNLSTLILLLPLTYGAKLIRLTALQNQGLITLFINGEILILLLNSLFYLLLGMFGYKLLEKIAKEKGLLAHY